MLDIAYQSLTEAGEDAYVIGSATDRPEAGYVWHYWIPSLALLDREHLRLRRLDRVSSDGGSFVFPLELRWEFLEWFARGQAKDFLTLHVPPAVLQAARARKAVILLFFGHEGRRLEFTCAAGKQERSAYDLILGFVAANDLPPGAVWFVSGNLGGRPEYEAWRHRRLGGKDTPDPFETRFAEPYSYLVQAAQRAHEQGFSLTVRLDATPTANGECLHQATHISMTAMPQNARLAAAPPDARRAAPPPKLFLCMNRVPRPHRRAIVCHLLRRGLLDRSMVSFRVDRPIWARFDDLQLQEAWQELQKRLPLVIDRDLPLDFDRYMQDNFAAVTLGEAWPYRDSCFSIVNETHFSNDVLFVSEKVWKPIAHGHPFMIAGTPGTLAYLRALGFRTFAPLIDEHYDTLVDDAQRLAALFAVIDTLGALSDDRRADLLHEMQPILAHNGEHLRRLRSPMARIWAEIEARLAASQ
jgi:hypothetical protein